MWQEQTVAYYKLQSLCLSNETVRTMKMLSPIADFLTHFRSTDPIIRTESSVVVYIMTIYMFHSTTNKTQCFTIYFCKTLYMFQTVFPSIISSSKLHIQRQVAVTV